MYRVSLRKHATLAYEKPSCHLVVSVVDLVFQSWDVEPASMGGELPLRPRQYLMQRYERAYATSFGGTMYRVFLRKHASLAREKSEWYLVVSVVDLLSHHGA